MNWPFIYHLILLGLEFHDFIMLTDVIFSTPNLIYFPSIFTKWSADQKSELVVFVVAAIYSRLMDKKRGALLFGFKTASSDLWGSNIVSFLGFNPDAALLGAGASSNDKSWGSYFLGKP